MTPEDKDGEFEVLKNQMFFLLVALIVVSGTVTVTLYRQVSLANKDITQNERLESQISTNEIVFRSILGQLINYGEKHPDYLPVLKKNGIIVQPTGAPAAPGAPRK
jgi:hypothetical protein